MVPSSRESGPAPLRVAHSRRGFLRLLGGSVGFAAGLALGRQAGAEGPAGTEKLKIRSAVVIGGGIAGLAAAHALARKGKEVTLLEQQGRVGGLLKTRRWDNGLYTEDGAEDINDSDASVWRLIRDLGLETEELVGADAVYFRGVYGEEESFEQIVAKLPLAAKARTDLPDALREIESTWEKFRHPFTDPAYHEYDLLSYQGWLGSRGWHPDVNRLMEPGVRAEACATSAQMNAFEGIGLYGLVRNARWFHLKGGNETLPLALARKLGQGVRLGAKVTRVRQSARDVGVTYQAAGTTRALRADVAILACPARTTVEIVEGLPPRKRNALLAVRHNTYLNPALRFRERFWNTHYGMKTWALNTDTFLNYIIDQTYTQPGREGVLVLHIAAEDGEAYAPLPDKQILELCLDQLATIWPRAREFFVEGRVGRLGIARYPYQHPGFLRELAPVLAEPVGRIFFCGDYTNGVGDLDGAAFSGMDVVERWLV